MEVEKEESPLLWPSLLYGVSKSFRGSFLRILDTKKLTAALKNENVVVLNPGELFYLDSSKVIYD